MNDIAKARDNWLRSREGAKCQTGTASGEYLRNRLIAAFLAGWEASGAEDAWQPIETLSDAPDLVLAYVPPDEQFPAGRMMIWRRDILARNLAGPTPEHLMFPATHWMSPEPPAMAREASDAT